MEVNDVSLIKYPFKKYKELPRHKLVDRLTQEEKDILIDVFVKDINKLRNQVKQALGGDNIIILTEPLCSLDVREQIFRDLYNTYREDGNVFFKIHPRDELDYDKCFPDVFKFDKTVPMEILNFFTDLRFKKVVGVFTNLEGIKFADEKVFLGTDFMDKYEDPEKHNMAEKI